MDLLSESQAVERLAEAGELEEAIARCETLPRDLGGVGVESRRAVFYAFAGCIAHLMRATRSDDALRLIADVRGVFGADEDPAIRRGLVGIFKGESVIWTALKEMSKALASLDEAWGLVASSELLMQEGTGIQLLLDKAAILHSLGRDEEGLVIVDAAMVGIRRAISMDSSSRTQWALVAAMFKLEDLVALDRGYEAHALAAQFTGLLREIAPELTEDGAVGVDGSEPELAAALAYELKDHEAWAELHAGARGVPAPGLAARAVRLYRVSEPWAMSAALGSETPADVAATTLRVFADGYAILTIDWTPEERARLPLARRAESTRLLRIFGVEDWAVEHGHPLEIPERLVDETPALEEPVPLQASEIEYFDGSLLTQLVTLMHIYELALILQRFPTGLEVMRHSALLRRMTRTLAIVQQAAARLARIEGSSGRTGATLVGLFIAQGLFVASHQPKGSPSPVFPPVSPLREILHETGAHQWLTEHQAPLPSWTDNER